MNDIRHSGNDLFISLECAVIENIDRILINLTFIDYAPGNHLGSLFQVEKNLNQEITNEILLIKNFKCYQFFDIEDRVCYEIICKDFSSSIEDNCSINPN